MRFGYRENIDIKKADILSAEHWQTENSSLMMAGYRLLAIFAIPKEIQDDQNAYSLCSLLCNDEKKTLHFLCSEPLKSYSSLTAKFPQAHFFEREIYEQTRVMPLGHPWLKPVRFNTPWPEANGTLRRLGPAETNFFKTIGSEVHEVAVGPVHAGIIEPGHFRFQCFGETVLNLEICLGFQHRAIENLMNKANPSRRLSLAECIAGDSSVGHVLAHCLALEKLAGITVPLRARLIRRLALEIERLANHTGDLGAIGGDTGFLPTSSWNGRIRGDFLNATAVLCGNRFGRNLICLGGTHLAPSKADCNDLISRLSNAYRDARSSVDIMLHDPSVHDRLDGTGPISLETAIVYGLVGMAARACGLAIDARFSLPIDDEKLIAKSPVIEKNGDVWARTMVRSRELDDSFYQAIADIEALQKISDQEAFITPMPDKFPPLHLSVAQVEGWRGEICHIILTDKNGDPTFHKIIDPSFHNWPGLAMALRGQQISDFPLCNKSFNLSYCGVDL